jgi:D-alanine-D-alanine ligase
MKVLVLLGGDSPEREVSLRSGKAVAEALTANRHQVFEYDPAKGYDGLDNFVGKVDCVFPILHGIHGEDGTIQEELENRNFKYLGSRPEVCRLTIDKASFKERIEQLDIATPAWEVVTKEQFDKSSLAQKPYVLKAIEGGSTIDCFIIRDLKKQKPPTEIFKHYPKMLLEEIIEGAEITVPVLGKDALSVVEIIPPEGAEFDYEHKYDGSSQELSPPVNVPLNRQHEAQKIAELIHTRLSVRHLSRTDMMIDNTGKLWVLELNTIPGLTPQSLYPKGAKASGLSMEDLVQKFLDVVMLE